MRDIARSLGLRMYLSLSSGVAPEIGEWERMTTTAAANAYIQPIIEGYLRTLRQALEGHHGVVIDPATGEVDREETLRLRRGMRVGDTRRPGAWPVEAPAARADAP